MAASRYAVVASGNWNATSTWAATSGGTAGASVPTASDDVFIGETATARDITIPTGYAATANSVTISTTTAINNAKTLTLASSTSSLTVTSNLTVNKPGNSANNLLNVNAGTVTVGGNVTLGGTGTSTGRDARIVITTGTLNISGNLIYTAGNASNTYINMSSSSGTVNLAGAFTATAGAITNPGTSIFNYNGTNAQTVLIGVSSINYPNLHINNTSPSGATLSNAISTTNVTGNVRVQSGTLNNGGFAIVGQAADTFEVTNGASFNLTGTSTMASGFGTYTFGSTSNVEYKGTNQTVGAVSYGNLILSGSGAKTMGATTINGNFSLAGTATTAPTGALTVGGNFTIGSGTVFTAGGLTHSIAGNWSNSGTFTPNTSTMTFNGSGQTFTGTTTFNNLTFSGSGAKDIGATTINGNFSLAGTATTAPTGALTVGGNFTIGSGTVFTAGAFTHSIVGNWSNSGTFTSDSSTMLFNGVGQTFTGTTTFNNLILSGSGTKIAASSHTIAGDLAINGVSFDSGTTIQTVNGNIANTGTHTATSGSITLSGGSTSHTLSGTGTYANLVMNDANGASLSASPTVSGVLTLTNGNIDTVANTLITSNSCPASISRISGHIIGNLQLKFPSGTTACTYPVGSGSNYTPIDISMTASVIGTLTGSTTGSEHTQIASSGIDSSKDANRYWSLWATGDTIASTSYSPTFNFDAADVDGGATPTSFIVAKYASSAWTWPTPVTATGTSTSVTGITGGITAATSFVVGEHLTYLADGTNPGNVSIAPDAAITDLDAFTLSVSGGTDSVTALTVTLTGTNSYDSLSEVRITSSDGLTTYFSAVANPTSNTVSFSGGTAIPVTTTPTTYKVRITPKTHANMPVPPGLSYSVGGTVTAFTSSAAQSGTDDASATVTVDNLSPNSATAASGFPGNTAVTLAWTTSSSSDFSATNGSVIYRWTGSSAGAEIPAEGSTPTKGNTNGTATVACVVSTATPSTAVTGKIDGAGGSSDCTTAALTNGQPYTYKIFQKDSNGNYDTGVLIGTVTPAIVVISDSTNPSDNTVAPGSAITDLDAFDLRVTTGGLPDSVTALTVTLTGTNSYESLSEVRITNSAGSTTYFSAVANPSSNTVSFSGGTPIPVSTTSTTYKIRITPKTHANMPVPPGLSYVVGGTVTAFTTTQAQSGTDNASATITVDNLSPANATLTSGSVDNAKVTLNWTTSASADFSTTNGSVVYRWLGGAAGSEVPAEDSTQTKGAANGTATVACVVSTATPSTAVAGKIDGTGGSSDCTTTALTNGQAYTYKIFQKDTNGNYDTGVTMGTFTPNFITLADGANPSNATIAPSASITDLDTFVLSTDNGTDSVTALTVTLTGTNSYQSLSEVSITSNDGLTTYFSALANPSSNTVSFSGGTPIPVTSTSTSFKIRITPKTHANMPVPPGLSYAVGGTVTAFTSTAGQSGSDATSATVTVDNLSPTSATALSGSSSAAKVTLNWTSSASSDFNTTSGSVVYRWAAATAGSEAPSEGATPVKGTSNGTATVACVVSSAASAALSRIDGTGGSADCTTTALTNGQAYTYKVFQQDSNGNYDVGATIGAFTPTATTLADGSNPSNVTIAPSASITDLDTFTLATHSGTDSVTALTVTLTGTNSFQSLSQVSITSNDGSSTYFSAIAPTSNTVSFSGGTAIPVTTTPTSFKVRITPKTHVNMPAPPDLSYDVGGTVTAFTSTGVQAGTDGSSATVTVDNLSPNNATATSGTAGNFKVSLGWTTSNSTDFSRSVMLRWTGSSAGSEVPAEGADYVNGNTITTATVVCVRTADAASTVVSDVNGSGGVNCSTTALTSGQAYTYKIFQKDSNGNYDTGVTVGSFTPPLANAANSTVSASLSSVTADNSATSTITVTLKDAANVVVPNKVVTLAKSGGSSTITTISGTTDASGVATFTVKDAIAEGPITYTATDTTDSVVVSQTAQVTFTPITAPTVTQSLTPSSIAANTASTLTITLTNPNNIAINGLAFTDAYPSGMVNTASASGATTCSGGTLTAANNGNSVALSGSSIPASSSCTVTVNVTSATAGSYFNSTGAVTSNNASSGTAATATLTVYSAPTATTNAATNLESWSATANGTVSSNGDATTVTFEYGLTNAYGLTIDAVESPLAANAVNTAVTADLIGLQCNQTFHYRVKATNSVGTTYGSDHAFSTTSSCGAPYDANLCPSGRFGRNLNCTANDVHLTGISLAPGSIASCVSGTPVILDLDMIVNFASPNRWDIGIFIANDGKLPSQLSTSGGATSCSVGVLPTTSPFLDLDGGPTGDTCGDGNSSIDDSAIPGGTVPLGDGVYRMNQVTLPCYANAQSGGKLFVPFVVSWDNQASPIGSLCTSNQYPVPNTTSKCNAPASSVAIDVVVLPVITKTNGNTSINPGANTTYTVVITNNSGGVLQDSVFKDPAVTNLTVNSVTCAPANGATCPTTTVAAMQGTGITIPTANLPNNSSLTFTVNATLSSSATVGSHLINTATVSVGSNSATATDDDLIEIAPSVAKSFAPSTITQNAASVLTVTLSNPTTSAVTGVAFTDNYPSGLVNTASANPANTCGGTVTAANNGSLLAMSGGTIPALGSCTVTVNVTSATVGTYNNSTGSVTTSGSPISASSAILTVNAPVYGGFNACDVAAAPNATCTNTTTVTDSHITTKVAGTAFSLDLVALNSDGSRKTNYSNDILVELLDASDNSGTLDSYNCRSSWTTVIATLSPNPTFPSSSDAFTVGTFTVPEAYRDVRVRVTNSGGTARKGCSTDNFAIRPNSLVLSPTDADWTTAGTLRALTNIDATTPGIPSTPNNTLYAIHKINQPFTVTATAKNASNVTTTYYSGTPTSTLSQCSGGTACIVSLGTLTLGSVSTLSGVETWGSASYSGVEAFDLTLHDTSFASVDAADTAASCSGFWLCSAETHVGRFIHETAANSTVVANPTFVAADGATTSTITVTLKDESNNPVAGKTVTLAAGSGSSIISAASGVSSALGVVTFTVKDSVTEGPITYTATNVTDATVISQTAQVTFTTTTLATGTDPSATTIAPEAAVSDVDYFTLQTSAGTEAISSITVNLSTNQGIERLSITDNSGTELGFTTTPSTGSNTITVSGMTATTTLTTYRVRITPLSHAAMPTPNGASYNITAPVTAWAGSSHHVGSDSNANALTIDNLSPAAATSTSGTAGSTKVTLNWTTSADSDFSVTNGSVVYRWAAGTAGSQVPTEGSTPTVGSVNGAATVACVVSSAASTALIRVDGTGGSSDCTTAALTNGQAYTYKVFQKDSYGNYDTGTTIGPFTPTITTLATGSDPALNTIAPGAAATDVDFFTLQTVSGTEAISSVTVNLPVNDGVARLAITDSLNNELGFVNSPLAGSNIITVTGMSATSTLTPFKIRVTPLSHAAMPPPFGGSYDITANVTAWTGPNAHTGSDDNILPLTIDNLSPAGATGISGSADDAEVTLNWTTSVTADFSRSVMLRWLGSSVGAGAPVEGVNYVNGNTISAATVVCVRTADASSTAVSGVDGAGTGGCSATPLTNGQAYTYMVFQKDIHGNYDQGVSVGTFTPLSPLTLVITDDEAAVATIAGGDLIYTFTFNNVATGFTIDDITVVGGSKGAFTPSTVPGEVGKVYTLVVTPTAGFEGNLTVDVAAGASVDANSNPSSAATQSVQTVDTLAPTLVITDDEAGVATLAGGDVIYTFTFSEAVTDFVIGDITVANGSKGTFTAISSTEYTLVVTPTASFDGNLTVDVAAGAGFDVNNNPSSMATQSVQVVDTKAPSLVITDDENGIATIAGGDLTYTFTFNDVVTSFAAGDITVVGGSKGAFTPSAVPGEVGKVYTLVVTPIADFEGNLTVDVAAGAGFDANNNPSSAATQSVQVVDTKAPTLAITDDEAGVANIAGGNVVYTFTFSEAVTGFAIGDITVTNGSKGAFTAVSATVYTLVITPTAGFEGNLTVDVAAGVAVDVNNNPSSAATQSVQVVDTKAPALVITDDETGIATIAGGNVTFTFTFSEAVTDFVVGDITVANGSKGAFTAVSTTVYTLVVTPTAGFEGNLTVDVAAGAAVDANNNPSSAATQSVQVVDTLGPTLAITDDEAGVANIAGGDLTYTFTFNDVVTGFTIDDITVVSGSKGAFTPSAVPSEIGKVFTLVVTPTAGFEGNLTVDVAGGAGFDANNNPSSAATQSVQVVDTKAPILTITDDEAGVATIAGGNVIFTFTFSEAVADFVIGDITVANGSKGIFTAVSTTVYTLAVTPTAGFEGNLTVDVAAGAAVDANNNPSSAATQAVQVVDTLAPSAPTIDIVATDDIINAAEQAATVTVTGTNEAGVTTTLNGNAVTQVTSTTWSYVLNAAAITAFGQGPETLTAVSTDPAGNTSSATRDIIVDTLAPNAPAISSVTDDQGSIVGPVADNGFTDDTVPVIRVSLVGTNALPGDAVQLHNNGSVFGSVSVLTGANITNNYVDITPSALLDGSTYLFTAKVIDAAGNSSAASISHTITVVLSSPTVSKSISPSTIAPNATSTLTINLANPNPYNITNASFTDTYPSGMVNATPAGGATSCSGAVVTANDNGSSITLSGATIPSTSSCNVTVTVTATAAGTYNNTVHLITSTDSSATATLIVGGLDHLQIEHDGEGTTCTAESITVKACANAACTQLATSSGTITATLLPSNTPVNIVSNGVATVSVNPSAAGIETFSVSNISPTPTGPTTCLNTASSAISCDMLVSGCSAGFDCLENGLAYSSGHNPLYTKLVGAPFSFDIVPLDALGAIETNYVLSGSPAKTVTVELFEDNGAVCSAYISPIASQTISFSSLTGRQSIAPFTLPNAYAKLRCRVTDANSSPTIYGCSSDNFSVRPSAATLTTSAYATAPLPSDPLVIKAGAPFTIGATTLAGATDGYTGTLTLDASKLTAQLPSNGLSPQDGGVVGSLTFNSAVEVNANPQQSNNATYGEVGYLYAAPGAFRDDSFTSVDQATGDCVTLADGIDAALADSFDVNNKIGCSIGNKAMVSFGRFIPDHLGVTGALVTRSDLQTTEGQTTPFSYMGEPMKFSLAVTAYNKNEGVTQNYQGSFAKLNALSLGSTMPNWTCSVGAQCMGLSAISGTTLLTDRLSIDTTSTNSIIPSNTAWSAGTSYFTLFATIERNSNPDGPYDTVKFGAKPLDADGVTLSSSVPTDTAHCVDMNAITGDDVVGCTLGLALETDLRRKLFETSVRFGRLELFNAYGSEMLDLPVPLEAQYWNGSNFVTNDIDNLTTLTINNLALGNYQGTLTELSLDAPSFRAADTKGSCSVSSTLNDVMAGGKSCILFNAPNVSGSVDLLVNLGSVGTPSNCINPTLPLASSSSVKMPYLSGKWCGVDYDRDPTARATFGIYKDNSKFIYLRELY